MMDIKLVIICILAICPASAYKDIICLMPSNKGECDRNWQRIYYNNEKDICEPFIYSGCGGNRNRFDTIKECEDTCQPLNRPSTQKLENKCNLPKRVGRCRGKLIRYYYNHYEGNCKLFLYGGCEGNGNNFRSKRDCLATCKENYSH